MNLWVHICFANLLINQLCLRFDMVRGTNKSKLKFHYFRRILMGVQNRMRDRVAFMFNRALLEENRSL